MEAVRNVQGEAKDLIATCVADTLPLIVKISGMPPNPPWRPCRNAGDPVQLIAP
jgi:hypothetical protein